MHNYNGISMHDPLHAESESETITQFGHKHGGYKDLAFHDHTLQCDRPQFNKHFSDTHYWSKLSTGGTPKTTNQLCFREPTPKYDWNYLPTPNVIMHWNVPDKILKPTLPAASCIWIIFYQLVRLDFLIEVMKKSELWRPMMRSRSVIG